MALEEGQQQAIDQVIERRVESRLPAAYLTGYTWFAGRKFLVDRSVLVPRSPLAELIVGGFQPWLGARNLRTALDIGTGSGCLAISLALQFPQIQVIATDADASALAVAARNCQLHGVERRVRLVEADLFPPDEGRYDLVISNPPYVPAERRAQLPQEYLAEPDIALFAGDDGFACVDRIVSLASRYLEPEGLIALEVGEIWQEFDRRYAGLQPTWVELEYGGEGIALIEAGALARR